MEKIRTSKWIKRFGDWVVTTYGVECLTHYYPIAAKRLRENDHAPGEPGENWIEHMKWKDWVCISDFTQTINYAKKCFDEKGKRIPFKK